MDWNSILENFVGKSLPEIFIASLLSAFITIFLTKFFENLKNRDDSIGTLILIESEIQVNKHILDNLLNAGLINFEKENRRGQLNEIHLDNKDFSNAAEFLQITSDAILFDSFRNSYNGIAKIKNQKLLEKILNLYTVEYHYRIQTSFRMRQLNWILVDEMKKKIGSLIEASDQISADITKEITDLRKVDLIFSTLKSVRDIFKIIK